MLSQTLKSLTQRAQQYHCHLRRTNMYLHQALVLRIQRSHKNGYILILEKNHLSHYYNTYSLNEVSCLPTFYSTFPKNCNIQDTHPSVFSSFIQFTENILVSNLLRPKHTGKMSHASQTTAEPKGKDQKVQL